MVGFKTSTHDITLCAVCLCHCGLTNVTDKLIDVRFLQQTQMAHAGESVESFVDDKLLSVTQTLLEEGLQDGGALPANVRCHAFNKSERDKHQL